MIVNEVSLACELSASAPSGTSCHVVVQPVPAGLHRYSYFAAPSTDAHDSVMEPGAPPGFAAKFIAVGTRDASALALASPDAPIAVETKKRSWKS